MTWAEAMAWATTAAHYTGRRYRVWRVTFGNGRSRWLNGPVDGWRGRGTGKESS